MTASPRFFQMQKLQLEKRSLSYTGLYVGFCSRTLEERKETMMERRGVRKRCRICGNVRNGRSVMAMTTMRMYEVGCVWLLQR